MLSGMRVHLCSHGTICRLTCWETAAARSGAARRASASAALRRRTHKTATSDSSDSDEDVTHATGTHCVPPAVPRRAQMLKHSASARALSHAGLATVDGAEEAKTAARVSESQATPGPVDTEAHAAASSIEVVVTAGHTNPERAPSDEQDRG